MYSFSGCFSGELCLTRVHLSAPDDETVRLLTSLETSMDRALASAAAALALAALSLALQAFNLEALGQAMAAVAAGGEEELGKLRGGEAPWAQRLLQVQTLSFCL